MYFNVFSHWWESPPSFASLSKQTKLQIFGCPEEAQTFIFDICQTCGNDEQRCHWFLSSGIKQMKGKYKEEQNGLHLLDENFKPHSIKIGDAV